MVPRYPLYFRRSVLRRQYRRARNWHCHFIQVRYADRMAIPSPFTVILSLLTVLFNEHTTPPVLRMSPCSPATNQWQSLPPLPLARGGMGTAIVYGGEILVLGGETQTQAIDRVDAYNPGTNSWRELPPFPIPRHGIYPVVDHLERIHVICGGIIQAFSASSHHTYYEPGAMS